MSTYYIVKNQEDKFRLIHDPLPERNERILASVKLFPGMEDSVHSRTAIVTFFQKLDKCRGFDFLKKLSRIR